MGRGGTSVQIMTVNNLTSHQLHYEAQMSWLWSRICSVETPFFVVPLLLVTYLNNSCSHWCQIWFMWPIYYRLVYDLKSKCFINVCIAFHLCRKSSFRRNEDNIIGRYCEIFSAITLFLLFVIFSMAKCLIEGKNRCKTCRFIYIVLEI